MPFALSLVVGPTRQETTLAGNGAASMVAISFISGGFLWCYAARLEHQAGLADILPHEFTELVGWCRAIVGINESEPRRLRNLHASPSPRFVLPSVRVD